ncbi:hypothetical protein [Streptomyces sp. MS2.AVA.5]|uniref:Uncharacterized protein n=1 Tax=Streptomyces achmelvichensis TaxID=3134111 RepID=A0ACC6Q8T6_9ACTN
MDFPAANRGRTAVARYSNDGHDSGHEREVTLADLFADLIIWAASREIDWETALEQALRLAADGEACPKCGFEVPSASLNCPACAGATAERH